MHGDKALVPTVVGASDGALAWEYLRRNPCYRDAWEAQAVAPTFEDAPFPIRVQTEADLAAARFALLAWADPDAPNGTAGTEAISPFWAEAPMLRGKLSTKATPLLALLEGTSARIEGLRLCDGLLVLKVEHGGKALQVRVEGEATLRPDRGGVEIWHDWGPGLAYGIERPANPWKVCAARVRASEDRELLRVLDGRRAGKSERELAKELFGAQLVAADWHPDGYLRSRVKRRIAKAHALMEHGYRELAAGTMKRRGGARSRTHPRKT